MIDARKEMAIELLLAGELNITDIAKAIGCVRQTIYDWQKNAEFNEELDSRRRERKDLGLRIFENSFTQAVAEYIKLTNSTDNAETKRKGLEYIIERGIGKIPTKTEVSDLREQTGTEGSLMDNEFDKWKAQGNEGSTEDTIHEEDNA